jgi:hypothetical protein
MDKLFPNRVGFFQNFEFGNIIIRKKPVGNVHKKNTEG